MTDTLYYGLGHIEHTDERDNLYPLSAILPERPFITQKMWWDNGWWGNQGNSSMCTCFSWSHWLEDGPLIQDGLGDREKPLFNIPKLYKKAQLNDGIPGTNYNGSTVRAVAKMLTSMGVIKEYRWANSIDEVVTCLLTLGPMVVGTRWYTSMFTPNLNGIVKPEGGMAGGHAYVLNGVDTEKKLIRIKNSWGKEWGQNGHAFISFDDFAKLLANGGQACMAVANKLTTLPNMDLLPDNDVA